MTSLWNAPPPTSSRGKSSPLQRVNPAMKLLGLATLVGAATMAFDPFVPAVLAGGLWLATLVWGQIPLRTLMRSSLRLLILPLPLAALTALYADVSSAAHPLFQVGPWSVTDESLTLGLGIGLRLTAVLAASLLYLATTDPSDFAISLIQNFRLPYRFAYGLLVSYRFLPSLWAEAETLRVAHRLRRLGRPRSLPDRLGEILRMAIPLLAASIRRSERTAWAMEARAFGAFPDRTYRRDLPVHPSDVLFVALCAVYALGTIALGLRLGLARLAWVPGA